MCKLDNITDQPVIIGAVLNPADKVAVNLNLVDLHTFQISKTGVASSKIIDRNVNPALSPHIKNPIEILIVLHLHTFRHFQRKTLPRKLHLFQKAQHLFRNPFMTQLYIGNIHTYMKLRNPFCPIFALAQCSLQHPFSHRNDHVRLLQNRNKFLWADPSPLWRIITKQRLSAKNSVICTGNLRLIT